MDKTYAKELALLEAYQGHLESGKMAKSLEVTDEDELSLLKEYNLLTYKPVIPMQPMYPRMIWQMTVPQ